VVHYIAHYPIRTRGTFCGSIAHADPAAEWCLVAAALGADMVARRATGTRTIPAAEFFRGIMTTALEEDELLTEVRVPILSADTHFGFYEFNRRAGDFALGMALVTFRLQEGVIREPRVALGGVEAQPRRIAEAEQLLAGRSPDRVAFEAAAAAVASAVDPLDDAVTSATYRRDLARTVTRRALEQAAA
jgi:carbon-monoxide dehydrogenase medium subunit